MQSILLIALTIFTWLSVEEGHASVRSRHPQLKPEHETVSPAASANSSAEVSPEGRYVSYKESEKGKESVNTSKDFQRIEALIRDESFIKKMNDTINRRNPGYGDLKALMDQWHASHPQLSLYHLALTLAVLEEGGASSALGVFDPKVCNLSDPYAASDARAGRQQGHKDFDSRFQHLVRNGAATSSEIEAESWPTGMLGDDLMTHARDCVKSWKQSPGHYRDMMKYHKRFCYSMARGNNGTYYCIGLFAD